MAWHGGGYYTHFAFVRMGVRRVFAAPFCAGSRMALRAGAAEGACVCDAPRARARRALRRTLLRIRAHAFGRFLFVRAATSRETCIFFRLFILGTLQRTRMHARRACLPLYAIMRENIKRFIPSTHDIFTRARSAFWIPPLSPLSSLPQSIYPINRDNVIKAEREAGKGLVNKT